MGGSSTTISSSEPRLGALRVQQSSYGLSLPIVYGRTRITGNLIWFGDFQAIAHTTTTSSGGKGGGGVSQKNTTYTYQASVMMALCEGPIAGIPSMWRDKDRYYGRSFAGAVVTVTENAIWLNNSQFTVSQGSRWIADKSVTWTDPWYYSPPIEGNDGNGGTEWLGPGVNYQVSGGVYTLLEAGAQYSRKALTVQYQYKNDDYYLDSLAQLGLGLMGGWLGQGTWGQLVTYHPDQAVGYSGVAYVCGANYQLSSNAEIYNHTFEVDGKCQAGGGIVDANPRDIITDLLTNLQYGASFPGYRIGDLTRYANYCRAMGLFISPAISEQQSAQEHLRTLAQMTNSALVWSEGLLKIIPYGDDYVSGNGAVYEPNLVPIYDLTDDDYVVDSNDDPVQCSRKTTADAFNQVQIEYLNRANDYNVDIVEAKDQANIERYGLRPMDPIQMHAICDTGVARQVAQLVLQRALYIRNEYEFRLGWKFALLEPMDLVTLTDSGLGLNKTPVRITSIEEDEDGLLTIHAEDYPFGVASATKYPTQNNAGYAVNYNVSPGGVTTPIFFEPPIELTETGLEVWCAVSGNETFWGGCRVWASLDGDTYKQVGIVRGGARYGSLTTGAGAAPGGAVSVQLAGLGGQLLSGTAQDAQLKNTLCWIGSAAGGEYLSYETATLTSANAYTLGGLVRGAYGTETGGKTYGAPFVRVDAAIVKSEPLDLAMVGKTIWFKFTSFNVYGGGEQGLPDAVPYAYHITGDMLRLPPSDVTLPKFALEGFGVRISWGAIADQDLDDYEIRIGGDDWETATFLARIKGSNYLWATQKAGTHHVWIKARDMFGNESLHAAALDVVIPAPNASDLKALIVGENVVLTWQAVTGAFSIDHYLIRHGTDWNTGREIAAPYTTTFSEKVQYGGNRRYWVAAVDVAGNVGPAVSVDVTISNPAAVSIQAEVIDNNVLLRWTEATTTLPVDRYEIRKGTAWNIGQQVGDNGNGRFATFFEQASGTYTYWIVAFDTAGNQSIPANVSALVNQPPDYVLRDDYWSEFDGVRSGVWLETGKLYAPLFDETWQEHFVSRGWDSPKEQIDAGFPRYFQPSANASYYEEIIDYGTVLPATAISATLSYQVLFGEVTITPTISVKKTASDGWIDYTGQPQVVATDFRYAKLRYDFTASSSHDLVEVSSLNIKLSTKLKNDAGSGEARADDEGGTLVNFNVMFIDVQSITVTAGGKVPRFAIYDFLDEPYPTSFKVLLYDRDGVRVNGPFSWAAKGV